MISILAALASTFFSKALPDYIPEKASSTALFDCRVWSVPSQVEVANALIWREQDAVRNSILSATQAHYSQGQLHQKNSIQMKDMLLSKSIDWDAYPLFFKCGTLIQRTRAIRSFTGDEIDSLPPKHHARANPSLKFERSEIRALNAPLSQVTNKTGVIFNGEPPEQTAAQSLLYIS